MDFVALDVAAHGRVDITCQVRATVNQVEYQSPSTDGSCFTNAPSPHRAFVYRPFDDTVYISFTVPGAATASAEFAYSQSQSWDGVVTGRTGSGTLRVNFLWSTEIGSPAFSGEPVSRS